MCIQFKISDFSHSILSKEDCQYFTESQINTGVLYIFIGTNFRG